MFLNSQPDLFGGKHPIPDGLDYSVPLGYVFERDGDTTAFAWSESTNYNWPKTKPVEPVIDSTNSQTWLQIWNGLQGGIYEFDFYYPALPSGKVYLRCFEVTTNTELSSDRLRKRTETTVLNHTSFGKIIDRKEFTIYEGIGKSITPSVWRFGSAIFQKSVEKTASLWSASIAWRAGCDKEFVSI